jgi:hypothetical protein
MSRFHNVFKSKNKRTYAFLFLLLFICSLNSYSASASAGYYPINYGETLTAETCVPKATKGPLILRIAGPGTKNLWVEVARVTTWKKTKATCGAFEYLVKIKWKVNKTGEYSLSVFAPNSQNNPWVWPDGVDIPETSKPIRKEDSSSILSRLNKGGTMEWITDPGSFLVLTPGNRNVIAVYLTRGCGVWVLPDKASTELFLSEVRDKAAWSFLDKKSKKYIALTTDDDADSASHLCVKSAAKTFSVSLIN